MGTKRARKKLEPAFSLNKRRKTHFTYRQLCLFDNIVCVCLVEFPKVIANGTQTTDMTTRYSRYTNIPAMQDQPVMGYMDQLPWYMFYQFLFDRKGCRGCKGHKANAPANSEYMGVYSHIGLLIDH
jgi:hypothetical protein